jgi:hypothetical protein
MANYNSTKDVLKDMLLRCGEPNDGTSEYEIDGRALNYINRAQQAILSGAAELGLELGEPWPWALNQYNKILTLMPSIKTLTVSATYNSTSITFGSAPSINLLGYYVRLGSDSEVYRISAHSGTSTSATLDGVYVSSTVSGASSVIFKIDYVLDSNVLRLVSPFITYRNSTVLYNDAGQIYFCDQSRFNRDFPINQLQEGTANMATQTYMDVSTMTPYIRVNRIPDTTLRVEYNYIPVPADLTNSDSSIPVVPRDHRINLVYYSCYYLLMDKNDNRAGEFRELTKAGLLAMEKAAKQQKILTNPEFGQMVPRPDLVPERRRLWWRWNT